MTYINQNLKTVTMYCDSSNQEAQNLANNITILPFGSLCTQYYNTTSVPIPTPTNIFVYQGPTNFSLQNYSLQNYSKGFDVNQYINYLASSVKLNTSLFSYSGTKASSISTKSTINSSNSSSIKGLKVSKNSSDYGPKFLAKVKQIAQNINCDYRDLLAVMNSESGINASKWCEIPGSRAVGLIQFTDATAKGLGTNLEKLANMSPIKQLDYVEKYFKHWIKAKGLTGKKLSAADVYAIVYTPAYVNKEVLSVAGEKYYDKNKTALDVNKDGKITKEDLAARMKSHYVSDSSFLA